MKTCPSCTRNLPRTQFSARKQLSGNVTLRTYCKLCDRLSATQERRGWKPALRLWKSVKGRCPSSDITPDDLRIPAVCPVLGIPLRQEFSGKRSDATPSVDRIEPAKGYVKGNVVVVSWRANRLKGDATLAELRQLATFYAPMEEK